MARCSGAHRASIQTRPFPSRTPSPEPRSLRASCPGTRIRHPDRVVVAADRGIRAAAVGNPELMQGNRHGDGDSNARVFLVHNVGCAVGRDAPAIPEVAVAGHPEARADRVDEMSLERPDRRLLASAAVDVIRVVGEERPAEIALKCPPADSAREPDLRFERPAVGADVDVPGVVILPGRCDDRQADPNNRVAR